MDDGARLATHVLRACVDENRRAAMNSLTFVLVAASVLILLGVVLVFLMVVWPCKKRRT